MAVTSFPPPSTLTPPVAALSSSPAMASASAPAGAMLTAPTLTAYNIPELMMYKGLLHEYIQKESLPAPIYQSSNEGYAHLPRFRSTVLVGQEQFTSSNVFLRRKEAEHDAAKTALECLRKRIKEEELSVIHEGTILPKAILNEYAVKRQLDMPVYNTIQTQGSPPVFISSVFLNGVTYNGENARTKKDAEKLAARTAVLALINDSDSTSNAIISETIKSKRKLSASLPKNKDFQNAESSTSPVGNNTVSQTALEVHPPQQAFAAIPTTEAVQEGIKPTAEVVRGGHVKQPPIFPQHAFAIQQEEIKPTAEVVQGGHVKQPPIFPQHAFAIQKVEAIKEGIQLPIAFVPPMAGPSLDAGPSNGKKRRKNKKKSKKKMRIES